MTVSIYKRELPSGSTSLYLDVRENGNRRKERLGITIHKKDPKEKEKLRIAKERKAQREIELLRGIKKAESEHLKSINFNDFADNYILKYRKRDVRILASAVQKFKDMAANDWLKVSEIDAVMMSRYMEHLKYDAGLSGETAHNYFTRFKKVLKDAKMRGIITDMPTADIRFSNPNRDDTLKKQVLDEEELQIMANAKCGNQEVKRAFLFACFTSLGLAEIRDLKWSNIRKDRLTTNRKKTGEVINNRLSKSALKIIGERKSSDEYLFNLQEISTNAVNKNIKLWAKKAGIEKELTFYCARHTFACLLLINGANLKTVADTMGHRSTKSTLKYLNHVQRLQDEAIDNLPI